MREIMFDTETTGFNPFDGDRLIEIGCYEMVNKVPTKRIYHQYINPERDVPDSAVKVHGLTQDFLADKPLFDEVAKDFLAFIGDDGILVAHNAEFDMKFINYELERARLPKIPPERFTDTLAIARKKFPGARNSLDALCQRFEIDNGHRTLHGALLDAEILAEVYIELMGGRQAGLDLATQAGAAARKREKKARPYRKFEVVADELAEHDKLINELKDPIWRL